eukprot:2234436-Pyramimonas_sp.AAC.1
MGSAGRAWRIQTAPCRIGVRECSLGSPIHLAAWAWGRHGADAGAADGTPNGRLMTPPHRPRMHTSFIGLLQCQSPNMDRRESLLSLSAAWIYAAPGQESRDSKAHLITYRSPKEGLP